MNEQQFNDFKNEFAKQILKKSKWFSGGEVIEIFNKALLKTRTKQVEQNQQKLAL